MVDPPCPWVCRPDRLIPREIPRQDALDMDAAQNLPSLASRESQRELRIRFASRKALLSGLRRARREPTFDSCHVDLPTRELVVQMAGGFEQRTAGPGSAHL